MKEVKVLRICVDEFEGKDTTSKELLETIKFRLVDRLINTVLCLQRDNPLPIFVKFNGIKDGMAIYKVMEVTSEDDMKVFTAIFGEGVLLVRRDQKTMEILEDDMCTLCGQKFKYLDVEYMRERDMWTP